MKKRFRFKKNINNSKIKLILLIIIIYISFSFFYRLIYNTKIKKMDDKKIIQYIIDNNKNNTISNNKLFDKIKSPEFLLKYTLNIDINNQPKKISLTNSEINDPTEPIIYIYSTHENENYANSNSNLYNIVPTIKTANYILEENLKDLGINCIVEEKSVTEILKKNNWSYSKSYDASEILVKKALEKYPNIELIIDLHRDSSPLSKTLLEYDDKKYAKVLFVVGKEYNGYEKNKNLAEKLNSYIEEFVPGISRGINEKSGEGVNGIYNQDLSDNSILIELGGQYNEIDEVNNTITIISRAILKYLEGE